MVMDMVLKYLIDGKELIGLIRGVWIMTIKEFKEMSMDTKITVRSKKYGKYYENRGTFRRR